MITPNTWLQGLMVMGVFAIPIQAIALLRMRDDVGRGLRELADRHGRDVSSALALLVFACYALVPPYMKHGDALLFHTMPPFNEFYAICKGILAVPSDHPDLRETYVLIWKSLTFVVPCLMYIAFNAGLTTFIWQQFRLDKL